MVTLDTHFQCWQLLLAVLHYGGATFIAYSARGGADWEVPVVMRFNVWSSNDGTCTGDTGCTINEYEHMLSAPLKTGLLVSSFSYISGTHHAIAGMLGPRYLDHLEDQRGVALLRWVDYAFSASLMLMLDSILWLAPPTIQQLVLFFCVMWLVINSGYGSECAWSLGEEGRGHAIMIYLMALAPFLCVWAVTWATFAEGLNPSADAIGLKTAAGLPATGGNTPPDFVIVILSWLFLTYASFPAVHAWRICAKKPPATRTDCIVAESVYSFLSFCAKIPLLAVYGSAVTARSNRISVGTPPPKSVDSVDDGTFLALGLSVGASFVLGFVMFADIRWALKSGKQNL